MAESRIIKLVFLRVDNRKCVVPLVEGCDFPQFLHRVRRRLGLADDAVVHLADASTGPVDSIDRLLEMDEGTTLAVEVPGKQSLVVMPVCTTPASSQGSASRARPRTQERERIVSLGAASPGGGGSVDALGSLPEVRLDVPSAEWTRGARGGAHAWEEEEEEPDKYAKRSRVVSLARSRRAVVVLLLVGGVGLGAMHAFS